MENFLNSVAEINKAVNNVIWGWPLMILLLGIGLWLTIRTHGIQFGKFGYVMKNTLGKIFKREKTADKGAVTPFQAVSTALSATVGTGNIAGVAGAIALGGPGAVFWMWVAALLGMATKYSEIVLAIRYRERNKKGDWIGGPMYYIKNGLGKNWKWLAAIFCILGTLASFGIGNIAQINTISNAFNNVITHFSGIESNVTYLIIGIILAILLGLILIGGIKRIGAVTEKLVPFMAAIYIIFALVIVFANIKNIGSAFGMIFSCAFGDFRAIGGGAAGFGIMMAMRRGFSRGMFSNEAGLGSAPIAHAAADAKGPVQQGIFGVFEVFIDTIVICTLTALVILMSGVDITWGQNAGVELTTSAFSTILGQDFATIFMAIAIFCFAFSTAIGWGLYGSRCVEYLFGTKAIRFYQVIFILVVIAGATMDLGLVWDISDTLNGMMAIPNLIALAALSGVIAKLTRDHFNELKAGEQVRK